VTLRCRELSTSARTVGALNARGARNWPAKTPWLKLTGGLTFLLRDIRQSAPSELYPHQLPHREIEESQYISKLISVNREEPSTAKTPWPANIPPKV
jgi:hypothetical protein